MTTWINVLLVDDDPNYFDGQADIAHRLGITLIPCLYWDEAYSLIETNPENYDVIVLDGKGQINANTETGDIEHVKKAVGDLRFLQGKGIAIPYVVNTGFVEESAVGHKVERFLKGTDEDKLYRRLKELATDSIPYRMRTAYPDIIPLFEDSKMGRTAEAYFLELFSQIESPKTIIPDPRNTIRKLVEAFCRQAAEIGILDARLAPPDDSPNLTSCEILILAYHPAVFYPSPKDKQYEIWLDPNPFPDFVKSSLNFLLQNAPSGSHYIPGDLCSHRLAKALFHALTVNLSWLQRYAIDHPDFEENARCIQSVRA